MCNVSVISLSLRLRLITLTSTLIIPDITKTSSKKHDKPTEHHIRIYNGKLTEKRICFFSVSCCDVSTKPADAIEPKIAGALKATTTATATSTRTSKKPRSWPVSDYTVHENQIEPWACFSKVPVTFRARKAVLCLLCLHIRSKFQQDAIGAYTWASLHDAFVSIFCVGQG